MISSPAAVSAEAGDFCDQVVRSMQTESKDNPEDILKARLCLCMDSVCGARGIFV